MEKKIEVIPTVNMTATHVGEIKLNEPFECKAGETYWVEVDTENNKARIKPKKQEG